MVFKTNGLGMIGRLVVVSLIPVCCLLATKFPDYPVRGTGDYTVTAEKAGFAIGVEPVEDLKEQKTYFKWELARQGVLPVFIVMENKSSADSFLFDTTKVRYGVEAGQESAVRLFGAAFRGDGGGIVRFGNNKVWEVNDNMMKKSLKSETLSPGVIVHGFVYLKVPVTGARPKIRIHIPITRVATGETVVLDVVL
jgi:hypothetical protein